MINFILKKIIGTQNERLVRTLRPLVDEINSHEERIAKLSDSELRAMTDKFRAAIASSLRDHRDEIKECEEVFLSSTSPDEKEKLKRRLRDAKNKIFADILPEAFAVVRETARRTVKMRHFDVQLMGGIMLHQGRISEMATGEGKTLVATLQVYLNALNSEGVHVVTVNDYLAKREDRKSVV